MIDTTPDAIPDESTAQSTAGPPVGASAGQPAEPSAGPSAAVPNPPTESSAAPSAESPPAGSAEPTDPPTGPAGGVGDVGVERLLAVRELLGGLPTATGDPARVDRIALLEDIRGIVAATQAQESVEFATSQVAGQVAAGVPASRRGRGVAEQIGYARRMSPAWAARELGVAGEWLSDLPAVYGLLRAGRISEWVAKLVAKQTRGLAQETRRRIAEELADGLDLPSMSPRQAEAAARRLAYEADPAAVLARAKTARSDRRVSLRPAPDTMAILSAFLPAEQGVAAWAALNRHAKTLRAAGDPRTHGQIMSDTLVERVTGQATADAVPVEIGLTMTTDDLVNTTEDLLNDPDLHTHDHDPGPDLRDPDRHDTGPSGHGGEAFGASASRAPGSGASGSGASGGALGGSRGGFGGSRGSGRGVPTPAYLDGYGPFPTELALDLIGNADRNGAAVWVRRLLTDPIDDTITHVDTTRRRFNGALARLIHYRDRYCRDPYCGATIRHLDHVHPYRDGGPTSAANGAGLCERGNYVKDMPGWTTHTTTSTTSGTDGIGSDGIGTGTQRIEVRTPTGHRYTSTPPPALGPGGNYRQRDRRAAYRRFEFLKRERLIATLPSAAAPPATDRHPPRRN